MARINIEDTIYTDARFLDLIKITVSVDEAIGSLVRAWAIAQRFYIKPAKLIPMSEWRKHKLSDKLIEVTLATVVDDHVRMAGIDDQFSWLTQRVEAGRKGGQARQAAARSRLAGASLLTPTLTPSQEQPIRTNAQPAAAVVSVFDFESLYKKFPKKMGKSKGLEKLKKTVKNKTDFDDLDFAIDNFCRHHAEKKTKIEFIPYFSTFATQWRDWVDPDTSWVTDQPDFSGIDGN